MKEGFGLNISEPDVDEMVKKAAGQLSSKYGTVIEEVSIPMHSDGKWYVNNFTLEISLSYNNDYVQLQYTEKGTEEGNLPVMSLILWEITAAYKFEIFMGSKVTWPLSRSEAELRLFRLFLCK